jgi:hypothetical protein
MKKTTGTIEVTIRIRLNQDITEKQARKFIDDMEYSITAPKGSRVSVSETEIIDDDLDFRFSVP